MKHLIITGDDFGLNRQVNEAIERDYQRGLLTQASLLITGAAVDEAVRIARRNPELCVGLHLDLLDDKTPLATGLRCFFDRKSRTRARQRIADQFERFLALNFEPLYWDGHAHLHLHPTLLGLALPIACGHRFAVMRVVREHGWSHPLLPVFRCLSAYAASQLQRRGVVSVDETCGLSFSGNATTSRICAALENISASWAELYYHPGAEPEEIDARMVRDEIDRLGLRLVSSRQLAQIAVRRRQPVEG